LVKQSPFSFTSEGLGSVLRHYRRTDSTTARAKEWLEEGAAHGSVVLADFQEAGRGRFGRRWESDSAQNLLITIVIKKLLPRPTLLPLAAAMAVYDTVLKIESTLDITLKWPNDVLIGGKKTAGILIESPSEGIYLLGIGINVNQENFPDGLSTAPTSLLLESGRRHDRAEVYSLLLARLEDWIPQMEAADFIASYTERLSGVGSEVTVSGEATGLFVGVSEEGGLILETDSGRTVYFAGDVTLAAQSGD